MSDLKISKEKDYDRRKEVMKSDDEHVISLFIAKI